MAQVINPARPFTVQVASPCPASWDQMQGDDKVRFCGECRLHVYNLSAMSRREAEEMVRNKEGRLCVRFFQRADGTVLTQDCPRGLAAVGRATGKALTTLAGVVVAMLLLMFGLLVLVSGGRANGPNSGGTIWDAEPFRTVETWLPWSPAPKQCIMGGPAPSPVVNGGSDPDDPES